MKRLSPVFLAAWLTLPAFAQSKTQTRLIFSAEAAKPGETVWAGLELKMAPHWHIYWRYSGDAGLPTAVAWTLPRGVTAGEIHWPLPEKSIFTAGGLPLCMYIYEDRVVLPVAITLDPDVRPGALKLHATLTWVECADEGGCVAGKSELSGKLAAGKLDKPSPEAALIGQWRERAPKTGSAAPATAQWDSLGPGEARTIIIDWRSGDERADFFPYEHQPSDVEGATERLPAPPGHLRLRKTVRKYEGEWPEQLVGILVGWSGTRIPSAVEVTLPLTGPALTNGPKSMP